MELYDLFDENELDTYISIEVPFPEKYKAKILTQEELGQGQEDHCWFIHGSTCTTSLFPKDTERDAWFLDQDIWRKEHTSEDDLKKHVKEEVKNAEVVIATLNGLPGSWDSFMQRMYARRKWLLSFESGKKKKLDS